MGTQARSLGQYWLCNLRYSKVTIEIVGAERFSRICLWVSGSNQSMYLTVSFWI